MSGGRTETRADAVLGLLAGLGAMAFYAVTWSGRYYHDGQFFVDQLEAGDVEHMHVAYLPLAWLLQRVLGVVADVTPEAALNLLSILSGGLSVGLATWLAARVARSRTAAALAGCVLLLAPSHWFASVIAEIHVVTAAGAAVGAVVAWHGVGGALLAPALATLAALAAHLTCAALFPAYVALALAGRVRRGREVRPVPTAVGALLAAATVLLVPYLTERTLGPNTQESGGLAGAAERYLTALVRDPLGSLHELHLRFLLPWGLCALGPVLLLARPRAALRAAGPWTLLALVLAFGGILVPTLRMDWIHGMYLAPLAPFCVLALALPLASWPRRAGRVLGVGLLAGQAWLGIAGPVGYLEFAPDTDLEWAEAAAAHLEPTDVVFLQDNRRRKRLLQHTDATVRYLLAPPFPTPEELATSARAALRGTASTDRRLFVDPWLLSPACPEPVAEAARALDSAVVLEEVPGTPLLRIAGERER